jgi:hypothetical protein
LVAASAEASEKAQKRERGSQSTPIFGSGYEVGIRCVREVDPSLRMQL